MSEKSISLPPSWSLIETLRCLRFLKPSSSWGFKSLAVGSEGAAEDPDLDGGFSRDLRVGVVVVGAGSGTEADSSAFLSSAPPEQELSNEKQNKKLMAIKARQKLRYFFVVGFFPAFLRFDGKFKGIGIIWTYSRIIT